MKTLVSPDCNSMCGRLQSGASSILWVALPECDLALKDCPGTSYQPHLTAYLPACGPACPPACLPACVPVLPSRADDFIVLSFSLEMAFNG